MINKWSSVCSIAMTIVQIVAPADAPVYELLRPEFTDAFSTVGTGWGNTYHRSLPLLRIDCIYSSDKLIPLRSRAIKLPLSDHRMVVADYIFR